MNLAAPIDLDRHGSRRHGGRATFLPELDQVTAGLSRGELWVLTGHPGSGKSMFGSQFALHWLREHKQPVTLFSLRYPLFAVWTRILSYTARVPLSVAHGLGSLTAEDAVRVDASVHRLHDEPLKVRTTPRGAEDFPWEDEQFPLGTCLLVIDDAQHCGNPDEFVPKLAQWARDNDVSVLLTVPTSQLYVPHSHAPHAVRILAPWSEHIHVAAEIQWTTPEPSSHRLELLYHRWGPVRSIEMYFEPFYGRFRPVDI